MGETDFRPAPPSADATIIGRSRNRRRWFWLAVAAAGALTAAGTVVAVDGYLRQANPATAVRGYFAAVARGDAPAALGYGDLPDGDRELLTSDVLQAQRTIAPISGLSVLAVHHSGDRGSVAVQYSLPFADGAKTVSDRVDVIRSGGRWRLTTVAVPARFDVAEAKNRAMITGAAVPAGSVLLFPGAVPITIDTPNLVVSPAGRVLRFASAGPQDAQIVVSTAGRRAVGAAVDAAVGACLAGHSAAQPLCPLPDDDRAVPGSLRASVSGRPSSVLALRVTANADGQIAVDGTLSVTGSYTRLTFDNVAQTKSGSAQLPVHGWCYATSPQTIVWGAP